LVSQKGKMKPRKAALWRYTLLPPDTLFSGGKAQIKKAVPVGTALFSTKGRQKLVGAT